MVNERGIKHDPIQGTCLEGAVLPQGVTQCSVIGCMNVPEKGLWLVSNGIRYMVCPKCLSDSLSRLSDENDSTPTHTLAIVSRTPFIVQRPNGAPYDPMNSNRALFRELAYMAENASHGLPDFSKDPVRFTFQFSDAAVAGKPDPINEWVKATLSDMKSKGLAVDAYSIATESPTVVVVDAYPELKQEVPNG